MQVCGQFHPPAALSPGKEPCYPLNLKLCELQSRCGYCGEEKNLLSLSGIEVRLLSRKASKLISVQTMLYRLTNGEYGAIK